jgi:tRNA-specific 2-thiouridylase
MKIVVAMSGGVDSSVAAAVLQRDGFAVEGAYMKNWINEENVAGDCPWQQDIVDARAAADRIGIPFRVVNLMSEYRDRVVRYLLDGYREGITPNPDVMCNREIKFGVFLEWARSNGFDAVATGHYARREERADGACDLIEGADKGKDQSYFLALLRQEQIAAARFPIGHLPKAEVRALASTFGLPNAGKKDSQGICFIGNVKMRDFLRAYVPDQPGDAVDPEGRIVGRHRGLHLYTLGQKRGVGLACPVRDHAYVVVGKDAARNRLLVAVETPDAPGLHTTRWRIGSLSHTREALDAPREVLARPRYRAPAVPSLFEPAGGDEAVVTFTVPQRAVAPGQICALYAGEALLGGGVFLSPVEG